MPAVAAAVLCLLSSEDSMLQVLNVHANSLEGEPAVSVENCGNLLQLNLADNSFSGRLPASHYWDELISYRASHNGFTGTFPLLLTSHARLVEHLNVSGNLLTGMLPNQLTLMVGLTALDVSSNQFTGTVNENIYYLPLLSFLDVSSNRLVGTIGGGVG